MCRSLGLEEQRTPFPPDILGCDRLRFGRCLEQSSVNMRPHPRHKFSRKPAPLQWAQESTPQGTPSQSDSQGETHSAVPFRSFPRFGCCCDQSPCTAQQYTKHYTKLAIMSLNSSLNSQPSSNGFRKEDAVVCSPALLGNSFIHFGI